MGTMLVTAQHEGRVMNELLVLSEERSSLHRCFLLELGLATCKVLSLRSFGSLIFVEVDNVLKGGVNSCPPLLGTLMGLGS